MNGKSTHTYAVLEVSSKAYQEVRALLAAAGYEHAFIESKKAEVIDMHGIALSSGSEPEPAKLRVRNKQTGECAIASMHPSEGGFVSLGGSSFELEWEP